MKTALLVCFLTWTQAQVLATVWEFGEDSPESHVVARHKGEISAFEKVKDVYFTVPSCHKVTYVRVELGNFLTMPAVSFNKLENVVTISFQLFQYSPSWYDVIVKAKRFYFCSGNVDILQAMYPIGFRRQYLPSGLKFPLKKKTRRIGC